MTVKLVLALIRATRVYDCCLWPLVLLLLWSPYVIGQTIIFLPCDFYLSFFFFLLFFFPRLISTWCGLSANLRCRSETCCTRLTGNAGRKKVAKNRHLGTMAHLCRAISSLLRHVSTIGKNLLSSDMSSTRLHNMVNFGLLTAEIDPVVWGTPANFNGFHVLAVLLHGTVVAGVSETLRRWTEGTTCVRQGDHHVGHWPTF